VVEGLALAALAAARESLAALVVVVEEGEMVDSLVLVVKVVDLDLVLVVGLVLVVEEEVVVVEVEY
jgi:hypothetical protein